MIFFLIFIPSYKRGLVQLPPNLVYKVPHVCGCADRFKTLFLAHIHDNMSMHHEKTPEDQTGHHWESPLSARRKFKSLVTRTERSANPLIITDGCLC